MNDSFDANVATARPRILETGGHAPVRFAAVSVYLAFLALSRRSFFADASALVTGWLGSSGSGVFYTPTMPGP